MKKYFYLLSVIGILSACNPAVFFAKTAVTTSERGVEATADDSRIVSSVRANLADHDASLFANINTQVNRGRVLLTGMVEDRSAIGIAEREARKVEGVKKVINEVKMKDPNANYGDDAWITTQIKSDHLTETNLDTLDINVQTFNHVVYLFGTSPNTEQRSRAVSIARKVKGVTKVVNHLDIST